MCAQGFANENKQGGRMIHKEAKERQARPPVLYGEDPNEAFA